MHVMNFGIISDMKLSIYDAVVVIAGESGSKLKMLLRARPFYITSELISLYKCHIFSFIESGTLA